MTVSVTSASRRGMWRQQGGNENSPAGRTVWPVLVRNTENDDTLLRNRRFSRL